jgi:hypothetical protein
MPIPLTGLVHRPFVDYYYATRAWCKLYLLVGEDDTVLGTIGIDLLRFEYTSEGVTREMVFGQASNYYALRRGVGGYLFMQWMKSCPHGIEFGGSDDAHKVIRSQKWMYCPGIKSYVLNKPYTVYPGEASWRIAAKWIMRHVRRRNIPRYTSRIPPEAMAGISIREESVYSEDLLPKRSPFKFRFAPTREYLSWRYNTGLSFKRYRLFRLLAWGTTAGYVIINEMPDELVVAQCDGEDPVVLAYGVLLSLLTVAKDDERPRSVWLTSAHPSMQQVYEQFGFRAERGNIRFALGSLRHKIDLPLDTSNWLISYDWGDNYLTRPFLDEAPAPAAP